MSSIDDERTAHAARDIDAGRSRALSRVTEEQEGGLVSGSVLAAFGLQGAAATPAPHPWNTSNTFIVSGGAVRFALRRWKGRAALERMRSEEALLRELAASTFRDYARPLPALSGEMHTRQSADIAWSAYEFIPGASLSECSPRAGAMAGELLARLHHALRKCPSAAGRTSRLRGLAQTAARLRGTRLVNASLRLKRMLCILDAEAVQCVDALLQFPYGGIHGDYVFDNILVEDRARLVDFEFARDDVQLLDIGGLAAPLRRPDGSFVVASRDVFESAVAAYVANTPDVAATCRKLLCRAVAAHWMLVADDLSRVNARSFGRAMLVLSAVTATLEEVRA